MMIINPRKLLKMARKWQRAAALGQNRILFPRKADGNVDVSSEKGHFIVYTNDDMQFSFPIAYLNSSVFRELFRMSEEEYGLPSDGPITLPCDSQFMGYVASLMQKKAAKDVEKALVLSMASCKCSSSSSSSSSSYYVHRIEISQTRLCGC